MHGCDQREEPPAPTTPATPSALAAPRSLARLEAKLVSQVVVEATADTFVRGNHPRLRAQYRGIQRRRRSHYRRSLADSDERVHGPIVNDVRLTLRYPCVARPGFAGTMLSARLPRKDLSRYGNGERPSDLDLTEPMLERHDPRLAETGHL
jgi:hypothetical protein